MFDENTIAQQVREFIVSNFLYGQEGALRDTDSFLGEGIIDSTGVLQLVMFLEESYGFAVADEDLTPENLDSIKSVSDYISRKTSASFECTAVSGAGTTGDLMSNSSSESFEVLHLDAGQ
jgi:acyl carrier protein